MSCHFHSLNVSLEFPLNKLCINNKSPFLTTGALCPNFLWISGELSHLENMMIMAQLQKDAEHLDNESVQRLVSSWVWLERNSYSTFQHKNCNSKCYTQYNYNIKII